jgi:hypothetical protein
MADAQLIADGINNLRALRVHYHGKTRVLEPYLLGMYADQRAFLLAWMLRCEGEPQKPSMWQHYLLSDIASVELLADKFDGARAGYNPTSDHRVRHIVCAVPARKIVVT